MSVRYPILLAAAASAAISISPAFAQDSHSPPIGGDASYGGALGPAYGGEWTDGSTAGPAYTEQPVYAPAYPGAPPEFDEVDAGADFSNDSYDDARVDEPVYRDEPQYDGHGYAPPAERHGDHAHQGPMPTYGALPQQPGHRVGYSDEQRSSWLHECRRRYSRDNGLGGALLGGAVGGVIGNRVAGKGNRLVGTVVGAGVGAIAGAAIDRAGDGDRARDECEDYLDRYEAAVYSGGGYGGASTYGYNYSQNVMWVPVVVGWDCPPKTKIVEEWVEVPAKRVVLTKYIPAKTKLIRTKTIKSTKLRSTK